MTAVEKIEPIWLDATDALAIHDRQLSEHGGGIGVRAIEMLESALGRPVNQWHYGENDPAALGAAYAFGVARNHPFVDGNKRTAWVLARLFLALNGHVLRFDPADAIETVLALASGDLTEPELADWFRQRLSVR
ncbi:MAG: type II toxin-antitoxin system death-on-curing family toxin [Sphingomonadales bacterium]